MKARLYYFDKKTNKENERVFDKLYRDLHCITRANDRSKLLADNALILLTNLVTMLLANPNKRICVNQDFISEITGKEIRQNSNLLKQLGDVITCKYHRMARFESKRYNYCYIIEFSEDGEQRAANPELFYTIDSKINLARRGKKLPLITQKITASYIDIKDIKKEERDPVGISLSSKKEKSIKKKENKNFSIKSIFASVNQEKKQRTRQEMENLAISSHERIKTFKLKQSPCDNGFLTEPSQGEISKIPAEAVTACDQLNKPQLLTAAEEKAIHLQRLKRNPDNTETSSFAELMSKVFNAKPTTEEIIPMEPQEIPAMKQEEPIKITDKETRKMLLSKAIFDAFGATANEIQDNCAFEELEPDKVNIKPALGVSFNDIEKAKIRRCIQSVYGEDVKLVLAKTQAVVTTEQLASQSGLAEKEGLINSSQNTPQWLMFRNNLLKAFLKKHDEKYAQHFIKNWFDKLQVSQDSTNQKLILVGSVFVINWINNNFLTPLENTVLASNLTVELHSEGNAQRPLVLSKQTIT